MAVHTLLMQEIQATNDENIPFYGFTDENLAWNSMKDDMFCETLSVLIDKAIKATLDTYACYAAFDVHKVECGIELVVRNT